MPAKGEMQSSTPHYSDFVKSTIECPNCKWIGLGATMVSGESFGDGVDKECPVCGKRWGYVGYHMSHEFEGATLIRSSDWRSAC